MLLSSSNRKYPPFPLLSYISVVVFVTSYSVTYCIYVPGKPGICFHYYCAVYDECKYLDTFWLADRTRVYSTPSHYHHCANLFEGMVHIKCLSRYIFSSVWVRLSIFSPLYIIQYVGLYVFSLPISLVMIGRIYILCLIIIKPNVWTITHCLGLGREPMVSAVCHSIFLFIYWWLKLSAFFCAECLIKLINGH